MSTFDDEQNAERVSKMTGNELARIIDPTLLLRSSPDAIIVCDRVGRIVFVSDMLCRMFDYAEQELLGLPLEKLLPDSFRESHADQRESYFRDPSIRPMGAYQEVLGRQRNGESFEVEVRLRMLKTEHQDFAMATLRDTAEIRNVERVQRSMNTLLEMVATGKPLSAILPRAVAVIEREFPGATTAILQRHTDSGAMPYALSAGVSAHILETIKALCEGNLDSSRHIVFDRGDSENHADGVGEALPSAAKIGCHGFKSYWIEPVKSSQGNLLGAIILLLQDEIALEERQQDALSMIARLTGVALERVRQDARIRAKHEQLLRSQKLEAVGQLAAGMSHEFSNLLQVIEGFTDCALRNLSDVELAMADLKEVKSAVERGRKIARDVLSFSRNSDLNHRVFSPNQLVEDLTSMMRPLMPGKLEIIVELEEDLPYVEGDPDRLQQALLNLCLNARDAMPHGGQLRISTRYQPRTPLTDPLTTVEHGWVEITVEDSGKGILAEHLGEIFQPFYSTKERGRGTGLGLSIVREIVRAHGGEVTVESEADQGTTFIVRLPIAHDASVSLHVD